MRLQLQECSTGFKRGIRLKNIANVKKTCTGLGQDNLYCTSCDGREHHKNRRPRIYD